MSTGNGFTVDPDQLRTHAGHVQDLRSRFGAVKGASAHIAGDEAAYGLLCGWISGVLEERHTHQDELLAYVEENLSIVAERLGATAAGYEGAEADTGSRISAVDGHPERPW